MFIAALWSRSNEVAQKPQLKVRIANDNFFGDFLPQAEQVCEVFLGSTWWKWKPSLFGYVPTPLKELSPRRIRNALAKVFVLYHIQGI